ncbi:MAG: ATP-binding cassette domain-containing protein, partial [Ignavibacteria bacterium]
MIAVSQCTMQFNGIPLFDSISFSVGDRDKIGLVGKNGAGKSTLLHILHGDTIPETGSIITSKQHTIGFLKQQLDVIYSGTVKEECRIAFEEIIRMEADIEDIQAKINASIDYESEYYIGLCEQLADIYHRLEISGG